MVDILVGPKKQLFRVHKKPLCSRVSYFDKMLNGSFMEAGEQRAELPEDDCDVFNLFLEWLYIRRLPAIDVAVHDKFKLSNPNKSPFIHRIKLYCFAEKLCLSSLMDYTMTVLMESYLTLRRLPSFAAMDQIYKHTSSSSPLRRFVAMNAHYIIVTMDDTDHSGYWNTTDLTAVMNANSDLVADVLKLMRKTYKAEVFSPKMLKPCLFHVHEKDGSCLGFHK